MWLSRLHTISGSGYSGRYLESASSSVYVYSSLTTSNLGKKRLRQRHNLKNTRAVVETALVFVYHIHMKNFLLIFSITVSLSCICPSLSSATTEYARQTGFKCAECHVETIGGGKLTKTGEEFRDDLKIKGLYRPLNKTQKVVRFIIGYIHLFFCNSMVRHNTLCPHTFKTRICVKRASEGRTASRLVFNHNSCHNRVTLLSIARIPAWKVLYTTKFGILLSIKVILFLIMVSTVL